MPRCSPAIAEGTNPSTARWMRARSAPIRFTSRKVRSTFRDGQPTSVGCEVKLEVRSEESQFPERARFELADALAGDAEPLPHLFERLRLRAREPEAKLDDMAHARVQALQRARQFLLTQVDRRLLVGAIALRVLDQVTVERLAVADRRLEADGIFDQIEKLLDSRLGKAALVGKLLRRRIAVQLLHQLPPRAHHPAHLLGNVDGKTDRPSLVGQRAGDRLADPPCRVGRKLVAHAVVELLHCPDQPEVSLLDQLPFRLLVALVLAARELPLLLAGQQRTVADLPHVEPKRVAGRSRGGRRALFFVVRRFVGLDDFERCVLRRFRKQVRYFHIAAIGARRPGLEHSRYPARVMQDPEQTFRIRLRTSTNVKRQKVLRGTSEERRTFYPYVRNRWLQPES